MEFKKYLDIKIFFVNQNVKGSWEGGLEVMIFLLVVNLKIDGVFVINDLMVIGVDLVVKQVQCSEFFIVGVDGSLDGEEVLKCKNLLFVVILVQDLQVMVVKVVEIGYDILQGKFVLIVLVLILVMMIDKNNVSFYKGWIVK